MLLLLLLLLLLLNICGDPVFLDRLPGYDGIGECGEGRVGMRRELKEEAEGEFVEGGGEERGEEREREAV